RKISSPALRSVLEWATLWEIRFAATTHTRFNPAQHRLCGVFCVYPPSSGTLPPNIFGAALNQLSLEGQNMDTGVENLDLDTIYELLSESRRRYVLYYLLDREHANVDRLALQIAAEEQDKAIKRVTDGEKETVSISLMHNHLPRLADHKVITYDQRSGDLVTGEQFDTMRATIKRAGNIESVDSIGSNRTESFLYSDPVTESTNNED
ncbi:DUF7344 domain-containing protein, partial [Natrinema amylolyticum]|uniref:DUF7344 domain-containing protein n=1 Tax=Natrinema amylolyticum TaxID=2878679 RepID=UPI001CFAE197